MKHILLLIAVMIRLMSPAVAVETPQPGPPAAHVTGSGAALALSALVAEQSPTIAQRARKELSGLLDGKFLYSYADGETIVIEANSVVCRASNENYSHHDCVLNFGGDDIVIEGRTAHELLVTMLANHVPLEVSMRWVRAALHNLRCQVTPVEVPAEDTQKRHGGSVCAFIPDTH